MRCHSLTDRRFLEGMYRMEKSCDLPQYLELDVSCNRKPVQRDQQCDMGSFGFIEDQLSRCVLNHLKRFDCTSWMSSQKGIARTGA